MFRLLRLRLANRAAEGTDSRVADSERRIDLTSYGADIRSDEDKPLFGEAVVAAKVGALRAAYVMIWLACAESLKRRFREAGQRDNASGAIAGDIADKESDHKSVDKFVLDKAKEYGFLADSAHTELTHVYDMRCLYGHPYEKAPSAEQVTHAAAAVVTHVLSRPVKLRHSYGERLLASLKSDRNYLDDYAPTVEAFARETITRLDESVYAWFLQKYWKALEAAADDPSMALFTRRAEWFSSAFLTSAGPSAVFSDDDWHGLMAEFPTTVARVCSSKTIFENIGERAQDSVVGVVMQRVTVRPSVLCRLEALADEGSLSVRQLERFREFVLSLDINVLRATRLRLSTCFDRIISDLKSYTWPIQNPALGLVDSVEVDQLGRLTDAQQTLLGRNVLQAAEGNAYSAKRILCLLAQGSTTWPRNVLRGLALECFVNEQGELRFKEKFLSLVLDAIAGCSAGDQQSVVDDVISAIEEGTPRDGYDRGDFRRVGELVRGHSVGMRLALCLDEKAKTAPEQTETNLTELFGPS